MPSPPTGCMRPMYTEIIIRAVTSMATRVAMGRVIVRIAVV
ncbi:Uncharacterised protein [Mycobacteroides abscessus subsp. abscessus]|nr:Uncharacterised protein [Mycobacteroides abscessus subsp. abscessus]